LNPVRGHGVSYFSTCLASPLLFSCLLTLMTSINGGANATILEGSVHDSTGQPVAGAMITVKTARLNATTISTYTANNGEFTFPYLEIVKIPAWDIKMQKVGYLQSGMPAIKTRGQRQIVSIRAQHIDNVATQVPPSAWLANIPDTPAGHSVVLQCSQCHQFPFAKVKNYIQKFSMLPDSEREKVWLDVMKFMRVKMTTLGPKNKADRNAITAQLPLETFANDSFSAWSHTDESDMAPVLTKYMPTRFDSYSLSDYEKLRLARSVARDDYHSGIPKCQIRQNPCFTIAL